MTDAEINKHYGSQCEVTRIDGSKFRGRFVGCEARLCVVADPNGGWYYAERWNVRFGD